MANKIIDLDWSEAGISAYLIIERKSDNYRMSASQVFEANPTSYPSMSESGAIGGRYSFTVTAVLNDGRYSMTAKKRVGASQAPLTDQSIGSDEMWIVSDTEVAVDASVSSRLASTSYTAPDNAGIAAVKAEVDTHPTLAEIEASTVLALQATSQSILNEVNTHPTLTEIEASTVLAKQEKVDYLKKHLVNQMDIVSNPGGTKTVIYYDDDGVAEIARHTFKPQYAATTERREKSTI